MRGCGGAEVQRCRDAEMQRCREEVQVKSCRGAVQVFAEVVLHECRSVLREWRGSAEEVCRGGGAGAEILQRLSEVM